MDEGWRHAIGAALPPFAIVVAPLVVAALEDVRVPGAGECPPCDART